MNKSPKACTLSPAEASKAKLPRPKICYRDHCARNPPPGANKKKMVGKKCQHFSPKMSKIHFPGLGTLRWTICTTYFNVFNIFEQFFNFFLTDVWTFFAYFPGLGCRLIWLLLARFGQVPSACDPDALISTTLVSPLAVNSSISFEGAETRPQYITPS